jgi:hypothetical protein
MPRWRGFGVAGFDGADPEVAGDSDFVDAAEVEAVAAVSIKHKEPFTDDVEWRSWTRAR